MDFEVKKGGSIEGEKLSEEEMGIRKGSWSVEEDTILVNYIAIHGEGSWNSIARCAGLKRSGKSCRLRWLNYLRPDVRRGNITLQEQIMILDLHSRWGNRWSKIAKHLPGRTDNEIKNYWRTRVIKQAKQLKCDVNSKQFRDALRYDWMPRLLERIQPPSETYCPTHISPLHLDPNPSASAARVHVHRQHGLHLHRSSSGTEWVNQIYSSSGSGPCSDSTSVDLLVHSDSGQSVSSEQLGHNVSVHSIGNDNVPGLLCPSFNNHMFEQGNTILPFGGGGGDSLDGLWNDDSIWLLGQLCDDLEIKNNFLA